LTKFSQHGGATVKLFAVNSNEWPRNNAPEGAPQGSPQRVSQRDSGAAHPEGTLHEGVRAEQRAQMNADTKMRPRDPRTSHRGGTRHRRKKKRALPLFLWFLLALLGLGGVLYGVDIAMSEGQVPRGVTVGGVDIGGMGAAQAEQRLRNDLGAKVREPVTVKAGNMSSELEPTQSGLRVDWAKTVDQAGKQPLNPITRIKSFYEKREVGIVSQFGEANLSRELERVNKELTREPKDAGVTVNEQGKADIKKDVPGQTVDTDKVNAAVKKNWLNKTRTVTVDADVTKAQILTADAQKAVKDYLTPATSKPIVFHGRNNVDAKITAPDFAKILSFKATDGKLVPQWNTDAAQQILTQQLKGTEKEFRNANFQADGDRLTVIPHQDGILIKWPETLGKIEDKALDKKRRQWPVKYENKKATYTTEEAKKAKFDDVVGEFTTDGFSDASGVNIRRVAEMVDGAILLPGETFSLNGHTGPRGKEQGFVESGIIIDGHAGEAVGGGISQFATTLYNASYFAGMEDVAHTPHSYYISRYPAGREATVYEGAIDLQFKNPFNTPVRIRTSADSDSVTVKIYGVKTVKVESIPGDRTNPTSPKTIELKDKKCSPSSGAPGFTTTDTRVVRDLKGKELERRTTTTVYDPAPIVKCK